MDFRCSNWKPDPYHPYHFLGCPAQPLDYAVGAQISCGAASSAAGIRGGGPGISIRVLEPPSSRLWPARTQVPTSNRARSAAGAKQLWQAGVLTLPVQDDGQCPAVPHLSESDLELPSGRVGCGSTTLPAGRGTDPLAAGARSVTGQKSSGTP